MQQLQLHLAPQAQAASEPQDRPQQSKLHLAPQAR
jgi:hypothetical protein